VSWSVSDDVDQSSSFAVSKLNDTITGGEKGVIFADSDVASRVELRATLTNDNASGVDDLTCENLYSKPLSIGIAPVLCRAATFSLRHLSPSLFRLSRWLYIAAGVPIGDDY